MRASVDAGYKPQRAADIVVVVVFAHPPFLQEGDPLCVM